MDAKPLSSVSFSPPLSTHFESKQPLEGHISTPDGDVHRVKHITFATTCLKCIVGLICRIWEGILELMDFTSDTTDQIQEQESYVAAKSPDHRKFLFGVHMTAEHLAQGELAGNSDLSAVGGALDALSDIHSQKTEAVRSALLLTKLIEEETESKQFVSEQKTGTVGGNEDSKKNRGIHVPSFRPEAEFLTNKIKELQMNDVVAFFASTKSHAILIHVERGKDSDGQKRFKVVIHNTGAGVHQYHYHKKEGERVIYQTAYEIGPVSEKDVCQVDLLEKILHCRFLDTDTGLRYLYETLLPKIGKKAKISRDPRLWGHAQIGGSCTAGCLKSFIRSQLDSVTYKQFQDSAKSIMILRSWSTIQSGSELYTASQKIVTLEVLDRLTRSLKKRGQKLRKRFRRIRKSLKEELRKNNRPLLSESSTSNEQSFVSSIQRCFLCLKSGLPEASIGKVRFHLKKAEELSQQNMTHEEFQEFRKVVNEILEYTEKNPMTLMQIAGMKDLANVIFSRMSYLKGIPYRDIKVAVRGQYVLEKFYKERKEIYDTLRVENKLHPRGTKKPSMRTE